MATVLVGIGTNLGDRDLNIAHALAQIQTCFALRSCSAIYESTPAYVEEQPYFLNLACCLETSVTPHQVLNQLKQLEVRLGRTPTFRNGPRLIDLDLLFYDDWVVESAELSLPHPRLVERSFVLVPLTDIAADWIHPLFALSVRELCQKLGDVSDQIWLHTPSPLTLPDSMR